jgi:hypothetical protein
MTQLFDKERQSRTKNLITSDFSIKKYWCQIKKRTLIDYLNIIF